MRQHVAPNDAAWRHGVQVKPRLAGIEAGRGLAATAVVLYHAARHINKAVPAHMLVSIFQFGHAGVDFFFVISGFIIFYVHERDIGMPGRFGHYAQRRFSRVLPTYWVALALTILLALSGGHGFPPGLDTVWSVFLLPSNTEPLLGVAWTLQYEIVFYCVFAVLILHRRAGLLAFLLWLGWIASSFAGDSSAGLPRSLNGVYNLEFFAGMAAAFWLRRHAVPASLWVLCFGIVAFAAASVAEDLKYLSGYSNAARAAYGGASVLIVLGAVSADEKRLLRVPAALRVLGAASYSIYLFQFVFIGIVWKLWNAAGLGQRVPMVVCFAVLAVCAVLGGIAASRLVEYPLMRLVRRQRGGSAQTA